MRQFLVRRLWCKRLIGYDLCAAMPGVAAPKCPHNFSCMEKVPGLPWEYSPFVPTSLNHASFFGETEYGVGVRLTDTLNLPTLPSDTVCR